ncbi:NAD(P)-dependent dehydrogenase (short-subunit alcohol dehydrogenase family) [Promicromonospora sp. AC04]|uniref:SDR family NAD(P)-dependent oxidoreductase n=1 Tax=Promicromonospora sp. AC04 TaxID=2135723 RepID=UPI000D3A4558|nr:SDR family oxidoreductase [Promicromonospora sp. AC04]PUB32318.1 NAD(P)-dependent dehydrogenase (short-subunit alcohol dehydrogenase family) [Promicromonospora sp. AC04]
MSTNKPLTIKSSVGDWLADPVGHQLLAELLAQHGRDVSVLKAARMFSLQRMVAMSRGMLPQETADDLVRRVNVGRSPDQDAEQGGAPKTTLPAVPARAWTERIVSDRFGGCTTIVTGAGSGIGFATASRILREGGRVIAVDVSAPRLAALVAAHPNAQLVTVEADITDEAGVRRIVDAAGDRIDGLANVAGIGDDMTPIHETSDQVWERVFAVNVDGTFRLTRAVVPKMLAAGRGSIVNVASEAALRGSAAGVAYTASKHAVVGMTKSSAYMYGEAGIRVNAVAPGPVATNIEVSFASALGEDRIGAAMANIPLAADAAQLAASITFLLSDDGTNLTGAVLPSDGGWSAL